MSVGRGSDFGDLVRILERSLGVQIQRKSDRADDEVEPRETSWGKTSWYRRLGIVTRGSPTLLRAPGSSFDPQGFLARVPESSLRLPGTIGLCLPARVLINSAFSGFQGLDPRSRITIVEPVNHVLPGLMAGDRRNEIPYTRCGVLGKLFEEVL